VPNDTDVIAGQTDYGGSFVSSIRRGHLYATQFHPEKSQADGLQLLRNFAERG
jgi:glutamine amidotransferase